MGVHAGVFFFDGRAARGDHLIPAARVSSIGSDGSTYADVCVAMTSGACHAWADGPSARRPLRSPSGLVIAWDGRLDNRDDLLLRLGDAVRDDASDPAIVSCAFERWGVDGLRLLTGEWSVAIWDGPRRMLHLARDYVGVRPLYYFADREKVLWSTDLGELAVRSGRVDALSEAFVARFMAVRFRSEITPYEDVHGVPAATCLSFGADGVHMRRRFWNLNPGVVRYRDKRQYEEHLRALWRDAVASRLRTGGTVWAELSGGLDSSSVVCMADWLIRNRRAPAQGMQPLSYVTTQSPEGDERRFIAEVEARVGVASEVVGVESHQGLVDPDLDWVSPFALRDVALAGAQRVRDRGGRVVLSGRVGDAVMGCNPDNSVAVLDDFGTGHVATALSNMRRWARATRKPFLEIAWQLTRTVLSRQRVAGPREPARAGLQLLAPRLRDLAERDRHDLAGALANVPASKRDLASLVLEYAFASALNVPLKPYGLVYTYPFTHRPLIEYVLAIPGEELSAPGEMRSLMRRAFDGFVPARILRRISKGYYPPAIARAIRPLAAAMRPVERLEVVRRGWIDPSRLDDAIGTLIDGGGRTRAEVQRVLRLEQWLTSRDRRGPAVIPQRKEVATHEVLNA